MYEQNENYLNSMPLCQLAERCARGAMVSLNEVVEEISGETIARESHESCDVNKEISADDEGGKTTNGRPSEGDIQEAARAMVRDTLDKACSVTSTTPQGKNTASQSQDPGMCDGPASAEVVSSSMQQARDELKLQRDVEFSGDEQRRSNDEDGWLDVVGNGQLKKKVLSAGSGGEDARPRRGQLVDVHVLEVKLSRDDALVSPSCLSIEPSHDKDTAACVLSFGLGDGQVVTGLDLAVALMLPGERAEIFMAAKFAYGSHGLAEFSVPADADLSCVVQLQRSSDELDVERMNCEQRLHAGNARRSRGNWWFQREDFSHAIQCYRRALDFLDTDASATNELGADEKQSLLDERLKVHNNMAAVQIKMCAYEAALRSTQLVLNCQPHNVKALFRKSKILSAEKRLSEAETHLKLALTVEPHNKAVANELNIITSLRKRESQAERSMYRRMCGNFNNNNNKNSSSNNNTGSSSGLLSRWGRGVLMACSAVAVLGVAVFYAKFRPS